MHENDNSLGSCWAWTAATTAKVTINGGKHTESDLEFMIIFSLLRY